MATMFETEQGANGLVAKPSKAVIKFLASREALENALEREGLKLCLGPESQLSYLSRFIIATNGNVDNAVKQIKEHQKWLQDLKLEQMHRWSARRVLANKCDGNDIDENYSLYMRGKDRYGHPVVYARAGKINAKNILKLVDQEDFVRYHAWLRERMMRMRDICLDSASMVSAEAYNPSLAQYTVVIDFDGCSMSQAGPTFYSLMQQTMQIDQVFYPERMFRSIFIHTPFIFTAVWRIVKGFLDKDTVAKLRIVRSDFFKYMCEIIDPSEIPVDYGGSAPPLGQRDLISHVTEKFFQEEDAATMEIPPVPSIPPPEHEANKVQHQHCEEDTGVDDGEQHGEEGLQEPRDHFQHQEIDQDQHVGDIKTIIASAVPFAAGTIATQNPPTSVSVDSMDSLDSVDSETSFSSELGVQREIDSKKNMNVTGGETFTSVHELQVALLRAHLEFEQVERETLEENDFLRTEIEHSLSVSPTSSQKSQNGEEPPEAKSALPSESKKPSLLSNPEIEELERQMDRLRQELEEILEETSAHQRAISFARKFIEEEATASRNDQSMLSLKDEIGRLRFQNTLFSEMLERAFGDGATALILKRRT